MTDKQVLEVYDLLGKQGVTALDVQAFLRSHGCQQVEIETIEADCGLVDFLSIEFQGKDRGNSPTVGIVGMAEMGPGYDGGSLEDFGLLAVLSTALLVNSLYESGDGFTGDVLLNTQMIRPNPDATVVWLAVETRCERLVDPRMDAVFSIGTVLDSRVIDATGFVLSPTLKEGWVLPISSDLLSLQESVLDRPALILPVTTQDITPYANELYHLSSVAQPATVTDAPVVAIAHSSEASLTENGFDTSLADRIETTARFVLEATKAYTSGCLKLFDRREFDRLVRLYGTMSYLQAPRRVR